MKILGSGSYSNVYDIDGKAVKIVNKRYFNIFIRELIILKYLNMIDYHYCPKLYGSNIQKCSITMEKFSRTLESFLSITQNPKTRAVYLIDLAHAIDNLHRLGIVHGDLKLANILIKDDGVILIDFGFSSLPLFVYNSLTTPAYSDPSKSNSYEGDIYSLGIIFLELLTGTMFSCKPNKALLSEKISSLDSSYQTLIKRMLHSDVKKRPPMDKVLAEFSHSQRHIEPKTYMNLFKLEHNVNEGLFKHLKVWLEDTVRLHNIEGPLGIEELCLLSAVLTKDLKLIQVYAISLLLIYNCIYSGNINLSIAIILSPSSISREDRRGCIMKIIDELLDNDDLIMTIMNV